MSSPGSPDAEGAHHELQQRFTAGLTAAETGTEAPFSTDQVDATLREARENRVTFSADQVEAMVREDRANRDRYSREHAQAIVQEARKLPDAQVGDLTLDEARGTAVGGTRRDAPTPVGERDVINAGVSRVELGLGATTEGEAEVAGRRFQVFFSNELEGSEAARFDAAQASSEGLSPVQQVLRAGEWHHDQRRQPPRQPSLEWPQERPPADVERVHRYAPRAAAEEARRIAVGTHAGHEADTQAQARAPPHAAPRARPSNDGGRSRAGAMAAGAMAAAEAEVEAAVARRQALREEFARAEQQETGPDPSVSGGGNLQGGQEAFDAAVQRAVHLTLEKLGVHGGGAPALGERRESAAREAMPPPTHLGAASLEDWGERSTSAHLGAASLQGWGERSTPAHLGAASPEGWGERSTEGSALVMAAQTQAFAATSALEQKVGVPDVARSLKDPNYTHGQYILRRTFLLGGNTSNIAPQQVLSDNFQDVLCNLFRNHYRNHQNYRLGFKITTCMVVFTVRVDLVSLISHVEQFKKETSENLVSGGATLDPPLKFETLTNEITDADVYRACCLRMAQWLSLVYYKEMGQGFATLANEAHALSDDDPSFKLKHFKEVMLEGGRVVQQESSARLAGENARLRQLGQPTLGANQNSFRHIRDLFTVPNRATGRPNLGSPVAKLSSDHPEGVLPLYRLEHADKLRRAGLAAQVERLEAGAAAKKRSGPSHYAKGPLPAGEMSPTPLSGGVTRSEIVRSRRNMPMGHETNRALCHNFAAHDGCPRATCPYDHTLPTDPLNTSAQLGL